MCFIFKNTYFVTSEVNFKECRKMEFTDKLLFGAKVLNLDFLKIIILTTFFENSVCTVFKKVSTQKQISLISFPTYF